MEFPVKIKSSAKTDIDSIIYYWIELLAAENYGQAYALTFHDPYYQWSPTLIESVINGYGTVYEQGEKIYKVTWPCPLKLETKRIYRDLTFFENFRQSTHQPGLNVAGYLLYSLPLNGEWSDLSVTFNLLKRDDFWALELNEIHVF